MENVSKMWRRKWTKDPHYLLCRKTKDRDENHITGRFPAYRLALTNLYKWEFILLNLNHCKAAQDLLLQKVFEKQFYVAIICEQYRNLPQGVWETDAREKAAVWACVSPALQQAMLHREPALWGLRSTISIFTGTMPRQVWKHRIMQYGRQPSERRQTAQPQNYCRRLQRLGRGVVKSRNKWKGKKLTRGVLLSKHHPGWCRKRKYV